MEDISTEKPWVQRELAEKELIRLALEKRDKAMACGHSGEDPPVFPIIGHFTEEDKGSLIRAIEVRVTDPRKARGVRYNFIFLMLVILMASCCSCTGPTDIFHFCLFNFGIFGGIFKTIPSHDTFRRILMLTDPEQLSTCLQVWLYSRYPVTVERDQYGHWMFHSDGKAVLASGKKSKGESTIYYLDATIDGVGMLTLVKKVDAKHNEQAMLPGYLKALPDNNAVASFDAGGTYDPVVEAIINKNWDYFLSLKGNQKNFYNAISYMLLFYDGQKHESIEGKKKPVELKLSTPYIVREKDHGGWNTYSVQVISNAQEMLEAFGLNDPKRAVYKYTQSIAIIKTEREREVKGKLTTTTGTRYYISSIPNLAPEAALLYRRNHWKLEAKHHVLDVDLNEDRHTSRAGYAPTNGDILRRFALAMRDCSPLFSKLPYKTFLMGCTYNVSAILQEFLCGK